MTAPLLIRRFLADYARNPTNLLLLVLVPAVFVVVAAGSLADAARLLGGTGSAVEASTAGWAAGFLAAIGMYFQVSTARRTDRRLVLAGLPASRLVGARLATGLVLAALATAAALVALAARAGLSQPARSLAGSLIFAVIYLAIGAAVGAVVRDPVSGTVLILFVWIVDVFFGPAMGAADRPITRVLPTHYVTLWMTRLPSGHAGRLGDLGWALAWAAGALLLAWAAVQASARVARRVPVRDEGFGRSQVAVAVRLGLRDVGRNRVLWALLAVVPVVFVLLADAVTPDEPTTVTLVDGGRTFSAVFSLADIHGATMGPIAVASLAALTGLFVALDTRTGDRRLLLAGFGAGRLLAGRLTVVGLAAALVTAVSLAAVATVFAPRQWVVYAGASLLLAGTYGLLGVLLGPLFGRVSGVFIAFLVPFLDLGIGQSPMLRAEPPAWARLLPGYGGSRVLLDGALTRGLDKGGSLVAGLMWLAALTLLATVAFRRGTRRGAGRGARSSVTRWSRRSGPRTSGGPIAPTGPVGR